MPTGLEYEKILEHWLRHWDQCEAHYLAADSVLESARLIVVDKEFQGRTPFMGAALLELATDSRSDHCKGSAKLHTGVRTAN